MAGLNDYFSFSNPNSSFNWSFDFSDLDPLPPNPLAIAEVVLGSLALVINILLLFILYKDPLQHFRNTAAVFITSLAMADTLTVTSMVLTKLLPLLVFPPPAHTEAVFGSLLTIGGQSSILVVTMFAFERFAAVTLPLRHRTLVTSRRAFYANLGTWGLSILVDPVLYLLPNLRGSWLLIYAGEIVFLCLVTSFLYPIMLYKFNQDGKRWSVTTSGTSGSTGANRRLQIKKRLTITILLITIVLVIFTVPYTILTIFTWATCTHCLLHPVFQELLVFYPLIYISYFAMNPLIYAWRLPIYRHSLTMLLCRRQMRLRFRNQRRLNVGNIG